jgi:WD40 repeat protein
MTLDPVRTFRRMIAYRLLFAACSLLLSPSWGRTQQQNTPKTNELPKPFETIQDVKQFNAVRFGPGNTLSVVETPPDFHLYTFAISPEGSLLAMGWGSGRIELWDLHSRRRVSEFKSDVGVPGVLEFDKTGKQLIVTGSGGKLVILDLPKGKKLKSWTIPLGKYKFDLHEIVLDPNGKWLAYADEESSKVLDITADPPKQVADLKDAHSIALSQDGRTLWAVNLNELTGFNTDTWDVKGRWPLKSPQERASLALVRAGATSDGQNTIAVPSAKGLIVYRPPDMEGHFVTDKPTADVAFVSGRNIFVNFSGVLTFLNDKDKPLCEKSYKGRVNYAISGDGQWLAISQFSTVDLWRVEDLLNDCGPGQ